jgi:hypothetical protein
LYNNHFSKNHLSPNPIKLSQIIVVNLLVASSHTTVVSRAVDFYLVLYIHGLPTPSTIHSLLIYKNSRSKDPKTQNVRLKIETKRYIYIYIYIYISLVDINGGCRQEALCRDSSSTAACCQYFQRSNLMQGVCFWANDMQGGGDSSKSCPAVGQLLLCPLERRPSLSLLLQELQPPPFPWN